MWCRAALGLTVILAAGHAAVPPSIQVEKWGLDTFRIRINLDGGKAYNGPGALEETPPETGTSPLSNGAEGAAAGPHWENGNLQLDLNADNVVVAHRKSDGKKLATMTLTFGANKSGEVENVTTFSVNTSGSNNAASYYGFGEHENGRLDQYGATYDMETCIEYSKSKGGEVCLPWILVADDFGAGKQLQFGLLWNVPAYGSVQFGDGPSRSVHRWTGFNLDQVDVLLTTYSEGVTPQNGYQAGQSIMQHYVDAVGHAPELPSWASGYWHSKNRYQTQDEVESTMDIFEKNFSIPVSVFVIDYFNWAVMGNLTFDPKKWPNPKAMVDKLKGYGTEIMVSTWPFSQGASKTYKPLAEKGFAVFKGTNATDSIDWPDGVCGKPCRLYDASNPDARAWWFSQIKEGYADYGIKVFWLDAAEPEQMHGSPAGSAWSVGSMQRVGMMFPYYHTQTYSEGLDRMGVKDGMLLSRSAWAGMSKHRAALWNGDTQSQFSYLKTAIQAGQSVQMSGIAWWTTDIGGYAGGHPDDPTFRELIVRWFQFGVTSPLFRQHGARSTEPWLLGDEAFANVRKVLALREALRPYVEAELKETATSGLPLNRPLFFDFPSDKNAWLVEDQFMFGRDYMVAPVYEMGARNRTVVFPKGFAWSHYFTGKQYTGGTTAVVDAPMEHFPLFRKEKAEVVTVI